MLRSTPSLMRQALLDPCSRDSLSNCRGCSSLQYPETVSTSQLAKTNGTLFEADHFLRELAKPREMYLGAVEPLGQRVTCIWECGGFSIQGTNRKTEEPGFPHLQDVVLHMAGVSVSQGGPLTMAAVPGRFALKGVPNKRSRSWMSGQASTCLAPCVSTHFFIPSSPLRVWDCSAGEKTCPPPKHPFARLEAWPTTAAFFCGGTVDGWRKTISHHFEIMVEAMTFVAIFRIPNRILPGFRTVPKRILQPSTVSGWRLSPRAAPNPEAVGFYRDVTRRRTTRTCSPTTCAKTALPRRSARGPTDGPPARCSLVSKGRLQRVGSHIPIQPLK